MNLSRSQLVKVTATWHRNDFIMAAKTNQLYQG
jgi:hypothetical protein